LKKYYKPDWVWAAAHRNTCTRAFAQRPLTFKRIFTGSDGTYYRAIWSFGAVRQRSERVMLPLQNPESYCCGALRPKPNQAR